MIESFDAPCPAARHFNGDRSSTIAVSNLRRRSDATFGALLPVIPDAAHNMNVMNPVAFNMAVAQFLER